MELMDHQKDAVSRLGNGKVLWGGVGSGKSATALAYYVANESPKDIYIITTAKKRDKLEWVGEAAKFGIGVRNNATLHGVITVDTWNKIKDYIDVADAFFIFDEQRLVGTGAWVNAFYKIVKKNNWIMLTATPGDIWLDYAPLFIANGLYRNITEFRREHVVYAPYSKFPKVSKYLAVDQLERYRNMLLVEMPFLKHTERHLEWVEVGHNQTLFDLVYKRRWHPYEERPLRDIAEQFRVMRRVVNSDSSRLEALLGLMKKHPKLIVFYTFDYELDILRLLADEYVVAEWNGHRKQEIPDTDSWIYLVQYTSGAEGWNCKETDAMIFWSQTYSYKLFEQCQGRIDRLDTPFKDLFYYVFYSDSMIDRSIRRSMERKRNFNERAVASYLGLN